MTDKNVLTLTVDLPGSFIPIGTPIGLLLALTYTAAIDQRAPSLEVTVDFPEYDAT